MEDAARIADLCGQLGYHATPGDVRRRLERILTHDNHIAYVAQPPDGRVVGWVHLYISDLIVDDLRVEIWGLVVDETLRGRGIGRRLMEKAETWARKQGCHAVCLRSNVVRSEAHTFYQRIGYRMVKTQHVFRKDIRGQV
jgi:GNAT superfamily N-acetyltransferase